MRFHLSRSNLLVNTVFVFAMSVGNFTAAQPSDLPRKVSDASGQAYRLIEANHFEMGARDSGDFRKDHTGFEEIDNNNRHAVILSQPFYLATTEVTVGQFRRFVEATTYLTTAEQNIAGIVGWDPVDDERGRVKSSFRTDPKFTWRNPGFQQEDSHPVVGVSYHDAKAYCDWLNKQGDETYRLPTEAEWECACRAGSSDYFSFGSVYRNKIQQHANVANVELEKASPGRASLQWLFDVESDSGDQYAFTAPVGTYLASPWGLHDMHGNVWEWCEDRYLDTFYDQFKSPGHAQFRNRAIDPLCMERWNEHGQWQVIRGGSWFVSPQQSRSASRGVLNAKDAACYVGFRVVRDVPKAARAAAKVDHDRSEAAVAWFQEHAREVREFHAGNLRIDIPAEALNDEAFGYFADLNYAVDLMVRPPGNIASETITRFCCIETLTGFGLATHCDDITTDTFAFLADKANLQWLQITGTGSLSNEQIQPHLLTEKLRSMSLQGDGITDEGLSQIPPQPLLETLHLSSTKCAGETLFHVAGGSEVLRDVSFAHLTDAAAKELAKFPSLQSINCQNSPITGEAIKSLATLRKLTTLHLSNCKNLTDDDFPPLAQLYHLRQISLDGTAAGDATVGALAESISLRDLRIGSENLTDRGLADICRMIPLNDLTIFAEATAVTDAGFRDSWKLVNLRGLTVYAPKVSGTGFGTLAELSKLKRLSIRREGTAMTEEQVEKLRGQLTDLKVEVR